MTLILQGGDNDVIGSDSQLRMVAVLDAIVAAETSKTANKRRKQNLISESREL
jgi:hypothetical protein